MVILALKYLYCNMYCGIERGNTLAGPGVVVPTIWLPGLPALKASATRISRRGRGGVVSMWE